MLVENAGYYNFVFNDDYLQLYTASQFTKSFNIYMKHNNSRKKLKLNEHV